MYELTTFFFLSLLLLLCSAFIDFPMSLAATLRKFATPTNVTTAAGWGGTAAVGALFLVQVRKKSSTVSIDCLFGRRRFRRRPRSLFLNLLRLSLKKN